MFINSWTNYIHRAFTQNKEFQQYGFGRQSTATDFGTYIMIFLKYNFNYNTNSSLPRIELFVNIYTTGLQ